jgi:hypothetical protein
MVDCVTVSVNGKRIFGVGGSRCVARVTTSERVSAVTTDCDNCLFSLGRERRQTGTEIECFKLQ